jgi:hypothetical protein
VYWADKCRANTSLSGRYADECQHMHLIQGVYNELFSINSCSAAVIAGADSNLSMACPHYGQGCFKMVDELVVCIIYSWYDSSYEFDNF